MADKELANTLDREFENSVVGNLEELIALFKAKNEQYGSTDPLANFRTASRMKYGLSSYGTMYEVAKDFMRKHIAHVENCTIYAGKVDESLKDIAVYSMIMLYMVEANKQPVESGEQK